MSRKPKLVLNPKKEAMRKEMANPGEDVVPSEANRYQVIRKAFLAPIQKAYDKVYGEPNLGS